MQETTEAYKFEGANYSRVGVSLNSGRKYRLLEPVASICQGHENGPEDFPFRPQAERQALREPVRKEKTQQVPAMETPPKRSQLREDVTRPYDAFFAGITIFDTVIVSPFISPVSLTV